MNILFVASEVFPFAKTGGLADVMGSLPRALGERAHFCSVILPFYKCIRESRFSPELFRKAEKFNLYLLKHGKTNIYFVENKDYYERDNLYGTPLKDYPDNALRFGFFAKAVVEAIPHIGRQDVLHCNDWQSALVPLYIKLFHNKSPEFKDTNILFTIHNIAYQGIFAKKAMGELGIPKDLFTLDGLEFYGRLNFMKAGILYADAVSTVSEKYSREIQTKEFGCGLDGFLRAREKPLYGISNGIDYSVWNPETDEFIVSHYNKDDLSGKARCKENLLKEFSFEGGMDKPLLAMVGRLVEQKGVDLVAESMREILGLGCNFIVLGEGDEKYDRIFRRLEKKYRESLRVKIDFDDALAHRIQAGSDVMLMPSRHEPCGLNQLYSLRYATIPIVGAVGGLDESIEEFDPVAGKGNGFKIKDYYPGALLGAIKKCLGVLKDKKSYNPLLNNCMKYDSSWNLSAEKYEELYKKL